MSEFDEWITVINVDYVVHSLCFHGDSAMRNVNKAKIMQKATNVVYLLFVPSSGALF